MAKLESRGGVARRLWPSDFEAFRDHLLRLDVQTRRDRFSGAVGESFLNRYAERAFAEDSIIFGYVVGEEIRGVAELCQFPRPHGDEGEGAFTVEAPYRLRGVGTTLFRRLVLAARNRGIRKLHVRCLPHNRAMQALARKHGARVAYDGDELLGRVETGLPTPLTLLKEFMEAGFDFTLAVARATPPAAFAQAASGR
jgi:RimJ/RimL family protein N-acetyltransferase